jgi:hypothetical protein
VPKREAIKCFLKVKMNALNLKKKMYAEVVKIYSKNESTVKWRRKE